MQCKKNLFTLFLLASFLVLAPSYTAEAPSIPKKEQTPSNPSAPKPEKAPSISDLVKEEVTTPSLPSYETTFFKMLAALVGVLGFLILGAWSLKKLTSSKFLQGNNDRRIKVLEKRTLSPKTMLYVVELHGKEILIAESQLEVKALTTTEPLNHRE